MTVKTRSILPGCTELGMTLNTSLSHELQQRMQQPVIADSTVNDTVKHGISVQRLDRIQHIAKSNRLNVLRQRKCLVARVNDGQRLELQIMNRRAHRGCQRRRNRALHLEAQPQPSAHDEQIKFGTLMCSPMICLFRIHVQLLHELIDDETFPGCAELGMPLNITLSGKIE